MADERGVSTEEAEVMKGGSGEIPETR